MGTASNKVKSPRYDPLVIMYQQKYEKFRTQYMKPKTIDQLRKTPSQQIYSQFDVLNSARLPSNVFYLDHKEMNRYTDIYAYQHSRIILPKIPDYYLNANQVRSLVDGQIYAVFSQAPLKKFDSFWQAVYYKNIPTIVMLCAFNDSIRGRQSQQYWPDTQACAYYSCKKLKVIKLSESGDEEYVERKFLIQGPEGSKNVTHMHWTGWSDLRKPSQQNISRFQSILSILLKEIENKKMIWIHCSAGIGRTGTLGGAIEAMRLYHKDKKVSVFEIVQNMRKYRYHAVQSLQQYVFIYQYLCKKIK